MANPRKYILWAGAVNRITKKIYTINSYRKKDYNKRYESWLIEPKDLDENKLFTQVDLMYIEEMQKQINPELWDKLTFNDD